MTVQFLPFSKLIAKDEQGWAFFLPALIQWLWGPEWRFVNATENNVQVPVTVQVADGHGEPSSSVTMRKGRWLELHASLVFQVDEAFLRRFVVVRKKRDGRNIKIAIAVEVSRDRFVCSVERIKERFLEIPMAVVQVDANPMILFWGTL